jgi:hypothetical protein
MATVASLDLSKPHSVAVQKTATGAGTWTAAINEPANAVTLTITGTLEQFKAFLKQVEDLIHG